MNTTLYDITDCTSGVPDKIKSDPNITGHVVFLSFITGSVASIVFSFISISTELYGRNAAVVRKMLLALSDLQTITGFASIVLALIKMRTLTFYEFHILSMFLLLSTVTHANTFVAVENEIKGDWIIRWFRKFVILINFIASIVFGVMIIKTQDFEKHYPTLSIFCLLHPPKTHQPHKFQNAQFQSLAFNLPKMKSYDPAFYTKVSIVFHVAFYLFTLFFLYYRLRGRHHVFFIKFFFHSIFTVIAIMATYSILADISHFKATDLVIDENNRTWHFGELLSILLFILPVIAGMEEYREFYTKFLK